ncbi:muscle M-line assembly protein unc-89-like [Anopheles albimanus]|uniref:muscle M-line assembly protein unc-89-like n=1 Tax=Anopheles albimanus TaxID=7167 RepID=UPI00163FCC0A|nr:muscle M-line assembly protein unc-89-like [Anopheles albimanus]
MVRKEDGGEIPQVIVTEQQEQPGTTGGSREGTYSREPSRERSSRSVSISRLRADDPLRKEMMLVREKSPFEIGENRNVQVASCKAIIDKALVMDVSGGVTNVDEYISLFFSSGCVIDEASCKDISTAIEVTIVEEEEERPELVVHPMIEVIAEEQGEGEGVGEDKKKLRRMIEKIAAKSASRQQPKLMPTSVTQLPVRGATGGDDVVEEEGTGEPVPDADEGAADADEEPKDEDSDLKDDDEDASEGTYSESEESSELSYSDMSVDEVDPSAWRVFHEDEDEIAFIKREQEEKEPEPTEREKDIEFQRLRKASRPPLYLTKLTDRSAPTGSTIKLQCTIEGQEISVRWFKNDVQLERSKRLQFAAADGLHTLTITHLKHTDAGEYKILAKNRGGEIPSIARVRVYDAVKADCQLPFFVKVRDYYHHALNDLVIECQIMFQPNWSIPTVTWLKNDEPILLDKRIGATYEGEEIFQLNIYDPTPEDSGAYTCIAENEAGRSQITHIVDFTDKVPYMRLPGIMNADRKHLTEEEAEERRQDELRFKKEAQDRLAGVGGGRAARQTEEAQPYESESFVIRDSKNKLTWAGQLHNITTQKGALVKMTCSANGPNPMFKWQRNGRAIDFGDHVKLMNSGAIGQIVINGVTRKDAGEYTCTAKNGHNEIKTTCVLKLITLPSDDETPATFTRAVKEFYDIRADDLVLEVNVHGVPKPTIKWLKDGEDIVLGEKLLINREPNGVYQLCIHKPAPTDCGLYECQAVNSAGTAKVSHVVSFTAKDKLIHVQHIEHADYFKRRLEEKEAASLHLIAEPAPTPVPGTPTPQTAAASQEQAPQVPPVAPSEEQGSEQATATDEAAEVAGESSEAASVVQEAAPEVAGEVAAAKPKPTFKAMPRKRFEEGPVEPFIIRDSKNRLLWETKLKNLTTPAGKTIKLTCSVTGPQPTYKWLKNGKPLVWSKTVINATKAEFGCVRITPTTVADSGEYTALAKNSFGEIECSCTVNIFTTERDIETVPTFTRVIDYYDSLVDDLILEVHVRGVPDPKLTWERDGVVFTNETDRVIISRQGDGVYRLSIHNPEKLDGGRWVVTAKNSAGEEKLKHAVTFKGREFYQSQLTHGIYHADKQVTRSEEDGFVYGTRSRSVSRAPSVALQSGPLDAGDITAVVEALQSIEATTEDGEQPPVAATEESTEGAPAAEGTEGEAPSAEPAAKKKKEPKQWRKNLQGLLRGRIPGPIAEETITKPKVLEVKQKLYFEANLKNQTVPEGSHIKLVCSVVGPQPSIKWFKNNIPLAWSKNVKNDTKLGVGAIHIISAELNDSGTYKCVASNPSGEVETSCKVTVFPIPEKQYVAPSFVRNVKEHYDIQTNDLILEVIVRGNPMPSIKWLRDGIDLQDPTGEKFFPMREPGGVFKLTIHDPQAKDEGQYACEASNVVGKDVMRHAVRRIRERKAAESHVFGIRYHDPNVMKHGVYEEPPKEEPAPRPHREFVFLEDGTYYIRGQTPEYLWEWETDTSAPSEYEDYVSDPEKEPEPEPKPEPEPVPEPVVEDTGPQRSPTPDFLKKLEPPKPEPPKVEEEEEDEDDEDEEDEEEAPPPPVKRGPKIKKLRKKRVKQPVVAESAPEPAPTAAPVAEVTPVAPVAPAPAEPAPKATGEEGALAGEPVTEEEKEKQRKERYLRLFPELIPEEGKRVDTRTVLRFGSTLHDISIVEGKPVRLFCTVLGSKADFKWFKNGEPMEFTKQVRNLSESKEGTGIIQFNRATREDSGEYEVVVKDKSGATISGTCRLTVMPVPVRIPVAEGEPPRFVRCMLQHYDLRVDDLVLETQIKGTGQIRVEWYLDGIIIPNNEKFIQIREPHGIHKLCIHNPQIRDNGRYTIRAINDFGTEELKYTLRFEGKAAAMPMYHMHHADKRTKPLYDEEKPAEPRQHREVVFLEDGSYYLKGQTPERFWEWETDTDAESEYEEYVPGDTEEEEEPEEEEEQEVEQTEQPEGAAPATEPAAEGAEEGEEAEEAEEVEAPPKPVKRGPKIKKLRRKLPKKEASVADEPKVTAAAPVAAPAAPAPAPAAEGEKPKMRLSQMISSGQSLAPPEVPRVKRWKKPVEVEFISHLRSGTIRKGKSLTLNCCCSDAKKIEVTWLKDDVPLEMGKRCRCDVTRFGHCTLDLVDLTLEDSGVYKCVAKTANGTATDSCRITVFELEKKAEVELVPPTFLTPLRELYHPTTNDLHLEIRVRGNPVPTFRWLCDGIPILQSNEKYEIFNQHYYEQGTKITTVQLIINDPQLRDSGKYTLIAKNEVKTIEMTRQVSIPLRGDLLQQQGRKKRMDDVVVENEAPRVLPKPPTPEPEPVVEEPPPPEEEAQEEVQEEEEEEKEEEEED